MFNLPSAYCSLLCFTKSRRFRLYPGPGRSGCDDCVVCCPLFFGCAGGVRDTGRDVGLEDKSSLAGVEFERSLVLLG